MYTTADMTIVESYSLYIITPKLCYYSIPVFPLLHQIVPHFPPIVPVNFTYYCYNTKVIKEVGKGGRATVESFSHFLTPLLSVMFFIYKKRSLIKSEDDDIKTDLIFN